MYTVYWQAANYRQNFEVFSVNFQNSGVTCHDLGYGHAAGVPEPHPIHILGEVKKHTHSYTSHSEKSYPFIYFFFQILPIQYTFWGEKIPNSYTFEVKMIPIDIHGSLKSIPF